MTEAELAAHKAKYTASRVRKGKTRRDREAGAANKTAQNRDSRASWQNSRRADGSNSVTFPRASCNGQRNRYQYTGKDGATVFTAEKR